MLKAVLIVLTLLFQAAPTQGPPKPLPPILLTVAESQPLRDAILSEQLAQLALGKAHAERQAFFYRFCAEHHLDPAEWEIQDNPQGGYIAINVLKKGGKGE